MPKNGQADTTTGDKSSEFELPSQQLDTKAARRSLIQQAKRAAREEDFELQQEGLHIAAGDDQVASYRGVGLGLYFKVLQWLLWMMLWMMLCSVPYIITVNSSVFTDYEHRDDINYGVKVFDAFQLSAFTFAAIVDNKKDNGTLQYMSSKVASTAWRGQMRKGIFLIWVSCVDAFATAIMLLMVWKLYKLVEEWLRRVDKKTFEVSDYSIVVSGLPPNVTAVELGNYFEFFFSKDPVRDKVMDVILVRGFSTTIEACKKVHKYEQLKNFLANFTSDKADGAQLPQFQRTGTLTGGRLRKGPTTLSQEMLGLEARIAVQRARVMKRIEQGELSVDAAIVTFNTESMRIEACKELPSSWWTACFIRRCYVMKHDGKKWNIWVRRAAAPDDFRFENMSTSPRTNMFIQVLTGVIMFAVIIVCAAFITWLTGYVNKQNRMLLWDRARMETAVRVGMANLIGSVELTNSADRNALATFCEDIMSFCSNYVNRKFPDAEIFMEFGAEWTFPNSTTRLLNERPIRKNLQQCSNLDSCEASACLPCYCMGRSFRPMANASAIVLTHVKDTCRTYQKAFGFERDGIKVAISLVIALINGLLTYVLRVLKFYVEKHWTTTDTELSFAVWSYLVRLINSVAVLLLVNCATPESLRAKPQTRETQWMQKLILDGQYDDFSPEWYNAVGFSLTILMIINVVSPLLRSIVEWIIKAIVRTRLKYLHFGKLAAPEDYNMAFRSIQFTLEVRVSDVLFNVTLALLFGSGMPLCYLICSVYLLMCFWWDRVNLLSFSQPAQRYQKQLPRFIMHMLPVLLAAHSSFGLWMHTYFKAELNLKFVAAASKLASSGIGNLSQNSFGRRITQPNGLSLLVLLGMLIIWLLFGRWILLVFIKATCVNVKPVQQELDWGPGLTYQEALSSPDSDWTLRGARTYRIHHLTKYKPFLTVGEAGRLWTTAQGQWRYTRLRSISITRDRTRVPRLMMGQDEQASGFNDGGGTMNEYGQAPGYTGAGGMMGPYGENQQYY